MKSQQLDLWDALGVLVVVFVYGFVGLVRLYKYHILMVLIL